MLVKVRGDDPSRLSSTERTVVNWLKSWTGAHALPGIAVVKAQGADVIVWTPKTCVVVVVKGFTERVNGTLLCSDTEPWTIEDAIAPLEGVQSGTEPMDEIWDRTRELERELRAAPGRESVGVMGIVLVIPQLGTRITLEKGPLPAGVDVVVGDGPSSLRAYFTRIAGGGSGMGTNPAGNDSWDAAQVGQALGTLGFAAAATYSDLITEGFPAPSADRTPPPAAQPPATAPPAAPIAPPVLTGSAPRPGSQPPMPPPVFAATPAPGLSRPEPAPAPHQPTTAAGPGGGGPPYPPGHQMYSVPFDPRPAPAPAPRSRRNRSIVPLVLLGFLVVVLIIATMCTGGSGTHTHPGPGAPDHPQTTTIPHTTTPDPTIPSDTIGPVCYPLQPCPSR